MFRPYAYSLLFLSIGTFFTQCSPAKNGLGKDTEIWYGLWEWEETRYVRRGGESLKTAAEMGIVMEMELLANGQLKVYHNKHLVQTANYQVRDQGGEKLFVPDLGKALDPPIETGILRCTAKSLEIVGGYNDAGGNQLFRRVK